MVIKLQRYFVDSKDIQENNLKISGNDAHHIKDVMRYKRLDQIIVNTYDGQVFLAEITEIEKKDIIVTIINELKSDFRPLDLDLAVSMIRKDNFELVLQKTTELGVNKIIPLKTENSIIKIDDFGKKLLRYQSIVKEASEQSERNLITEIADLTEIERLDVSSYKYKFVCYAREASRSLNQELSGYKKGDKALVLIGPEGGFSIREIELLKQRGFISVSLGKTILRAETASVYVASVFRYLEENAI